MLTIITCRYKYIYARIVVVVVVDGCGARGYAP